MPISIKMDIGFAYVIDEYIVVVSSGSDMMGEGFYPTYLLYMAIRQRECRFESSRIHSFNSSVLGSCINQVVMPLNCADSLRMLQERALRTLLEIVEKDESALVVT